LILVIDNYDSFVGNVARYLVELGAEVEIVRNDAIDASAAAAKEPRAVVVSPGPCTPGQAGRSNEIVAALSGTTPILGICLGHQCIGEVFGANVRRAKEPMHGRASAIRHGGTGLFEGLPQPLTVGRYHSLVVETDGRETPLVVTARSDMGEVMALRHQSHPTFGVQFHPESILTESGHAMFANFLRLAGIGERS
jgi:anthranilate synthase component 2/para-aminobenzoate synthetase component 2